MFDCVADIDSQIVCFSPSSGALRGIKELCCGGAHKDESRADLTRNGLVLESYLGRTELVTERLPLLDDINIRFDFSIDHLVERSSIFQIIYYQPPCFNQGNYQLVSDNGGLSFIARNLYGASDSEYYLSDYEEGVEYTLKVSASFSIVDGYFNLKLSSGDEVLFDKSLVESGSTGVDCPLGPYVKAGPYGNIKDGAVMTVHGLEVYYAK
ncbi:hypothetical protein [Oceanobacter kriegii]|uniref:hypothetical protein n=1 Tax=Oceanobacter kriegii TaxID=64972 RepID=UPI000481C398|nr:hypothetical protein [Oceanobacter kriegii]